MTTEIEQKLPELYRNYRGHKIELSSVDFKFHITGPDFEQYKAEYTTFPSFDEARARIDTEVDGNEKLRAKNLVFREIVLDETGQKVEITGINRATGDLKVEGRYVYPSVGWVQTDLQRSFQLKKELKTIQVRLEPLRVTVSRSYSRISAEEYPEKIEQLKKALDENKAAAQQSSESEPKLEKSA
jgi:hypothetical protein